MGQPELTPSGGQAGEPPEAPETAQAVLGHPAMPTYETISARLLLPAEAEETLEETARLEAEALSPFEEGSYSVGCECLGRRGEEWVVWVALAADERLTERWHDALSERRALAKERVDLTLFGWLKALAKVYPKALQGTHLVAIREAQEQLLMVLSEGVPEGVRALPGGAADGDFARETLLLLTQTALPGGDLRPEQVVCIAPEASAAAPLREVLGMEPIFVALPEDEARARLEAGLGERVADAKATFDLTPDSWREEARAARQKKALLWGGSLLGVLWALCALGLTLLPKYYQKLATDVTTQIARQHRAYMEVQDLRERISLIERYQDRSNSALEMLRLLCAAKAKTMTFLSVTYRQKQQLKVSGLADDTSDVYAFKEALQKDGRLQEVKITRLAQDPKTRKHRFDVDIVFPSEEGQES